MQQENGIFYNYEDVSEGDLNINVRKLWEALWSRRILLTKVFCSVLIFFILLTFILPKKYKVTADLYISKANSSNLTEINPYVINELQEHNILIGTDTVLNNEIEMMKSALVLDKVIRENNIVYTKKYGILPNKKEGEFLTAKAFYNKGKNLQIGNLRNTNIIEIKYTSKKPEVAYNVVTSLIANYVELHKELNTEKSKSDKKLLESEYAKTKGNLEKKLNQATGIPVQSMSGIGNLSAMSAFSKSASQAMSNIKSQYISGEKSQLAVSEESQKLSQLATKLEWAKMVEQMSDSSKVLVLNEPQMLRPFENTSPKLLINIILGIVFGSFCSLVTLIFVEVKDKKVSYTMLTDNIIFDYMNKSACINSEIYSYNPRKVLVLSMTQLPNDMINSLSNIPNVNIAYYDGDNRFVDNISVADKIILVSKIGVTSSDIYKTARKIIINQKKTIIYDIII